MAASRKRAAAAASEVRAKVSSLTVADTKLDNFICWCKERKFDISPKVCVERERVCAQYGMVATEDIYKGEVLFSIPRPSLLSPETSSISKLLMQAEQEMGSDSGWVPLLLALVYEYNHPASLWRPYLDLVPDFSQLDLPMFWSSEEVDSLLKGTGVDDAVHRDLTLMKKDFNTKALPFMQKHPDVFSPACQKFDLYQRMVAFIMAYSFTEPAGKAEEEEEEEKNGKGDKDEEDSYTEDEGPSPAPMMVPLADILNHVAKNNAELTFQAEALRMVSTQTIKKGEEVFNTYGELANTHLLHMYGFAERYPDNHNDTVDIAVSVVTAAVEAECGDIKLKADKLLFLEGQGLHQQSYVLGMEGVLTDDEMTAVLKVLVMTEEEFREHAVKEGWSDAESEEGDQEAIPLTFEKIPDLPTKWKQILSRCSAACLSQLAGDEQTDAVAMETGSAGLSSRSLFALYVRHGQRQLLHRLTQACTGR